ncbi:MAG: hypothetical protein B5766_08510 [Candidatus Lumbricidophila eiseniae]|uniref:Uncharacterized protein n=1 Tax=Candidatus Lumbricidiphila eiseniae TaxID=1969409 RepID=A0A2A6FQZ7_9MICO|nr:MAG: hypothetical protein B5766_08510 [Candidatus Lumbricidophila eiseniae]
MFTPFSLMHWTNLSSGSTELVAAVGFPDAVARVATFGVLWEQPVSASAPIIATATILPIDTDLCNMRSVLEIVR